MVATSGIPACHSKGMLLTLHDTSGCRENTARTWMSRLRDEGMQKCMDGLAEDERQHTTGQWKQWSEARVEGGGAPEFWKDYVVISRKLQPGDGT